MESAIFDRGQYILFTLLAGWKMKLGLALWLAAVITASRRRFFVARWRIRWIVSAGMAFCLFSAMLGNTLTHRYLFYRHESWDPAVPENREIPRYQAINARARQGNVDLIFLGDSITQAWETIGIDEWIKRYEPRHAMNAGCSADRTQHMLWRLDHGNIENLTPKLVVLLIGTNNLGHNPPAAISRGIKAIVEKLRTKLPSTKILIMGVFPRGKLADDPLRAQTTAVNAHTGNFDDGDMVHFLDIGDPLLTPDGMLNSELVFDGIHLSSNGYEVWGSAIESKVAELLDEK